MRIAVIGTGYVGLVSGACFSEFGVDVVCVDKDADKIRRLKDGKIPIFEPGLDALVESNARAGRLTFSSDLPSAVAGADAVFIAVGTPSRRGDGHADLSYVYAAAEEIGRALTGYAVVVTKSTVPVGTGREVLLVDVLDDLRLRQYQEVVVALDVARPVRKALAAIARLIQLVALDHGAHGAIDDQDAIGGGLLEGGADVFLAHDLLLFVFSSPPCAARGVRPSGGAIPGGGRWHRRGRRGSACRSGSS